MLKEKYSCAVIGGGLGGIVMASMLSLYGIDTILIEKNNYLGGLITDYKVGTYTFSHSIDWFSGLHEEGKVHYWLNKIGMLDAFQFEQIPIFKRVISEQVNIPLYSNFDRCAEELIKIFPKEEKNILEFMEMIKSFGTPKWIQYFRPFKKETFMAVLDHFFEDKVLKTVLSANLNNDMSAYLYILFLYRCFNQQIYLPKNISLLEFFQILEEQIQSMGVTVLKNANVQKIQMEGACVSSIMLEDGRCINVDGIITDVDTKYVYNFLLPEGAVNNYFMKKLNARETSTSLISTFVGVKAEFKNITTAGEPIVYVPTYDSMDKYSQDPDKWHVKVTVKSQIQPFLCQEGCSAIDIRTFVPSGHFTEKRVSAGYQKDENYRKEKKYFEENLIRVSEKIIGKYTDKIECKRTATPYTFNRFSNGEHGSAMGFALEPLAYVNGFSIMSPIKNLFHVGSFASFPGIEGVVNYCFSLLPRIVRFYGKV